MGGEELVGTTLVNCFRPPESTGDETGETGVEGEKNLRARPIGERLKKLESGLDIGFDRGEPALSGLSEAFRISSPLVETTPTPFPTPDSLMSPLNPREDANDRRDKIDLGDNGSPALEFADDPDLESPFFRRSNAF